MRCSCLVRPRSDCCRAAWLDVLQAVAAGAYADVALERVLQAGPQASDRGLVTELAYSAIRQRRTLDAWLDRLGKVTASSNRPAALAVARGALSTAVDGAD